MFIAIFANYKNNCRIMKKSLIPILIAALAIYSSCSPKEYDVYLLIGQSNMAGRGTLTEDDFNTTIEGVFLLDSLDRPVAASHPYNQYSTIRKDMRLQQMGPGHAFGTKMHEISRRPVLLVVNARGGSELDSWMPGSLHFNEAVRRTAEAEKYGKLKGILWLQGCTDCDLGKTDSYMERLAEMAEVLRDSLSAGDVPFVAGEVPHWWNGSSDFNKNIRTISDRIPLSGWISTEGCGMLKDETDPHYDRNSQFVIGSRFAERILELQ